MNENSHNMNLMCKVVSLLTTPVWEYAADEWEISKCEENKNPSVICVCGKQGIKYVYTIHNPCTEAYISPVCSDCIKTFSREDFDKELLKEAD